MKDLISRQLVKYLEARGVEHVFGLCGHTNIAVLAELAKSRIKFVNVRHEQIAAHMADGYARAKKRTAVVLSHLGPGLTNAATGVANAALDSIPMVVFAGDVPTHYHGKHPHQEVNLHADAAQYEIYRPFVKRAWRVDQPQLFPEIVEKAFALAESGRPGPVLVDVPMDIFSREIAVELFERLGHNAKSLKKPSLDEETAAEIVRKLLAAKRPVLYVGGGVLLADATAELRQFVDHLQIPVAHTLMGKGALPDDHPFVLGMTGFWGTQFINDQCRNADWILALGTRFSEADCSSWEREYTFSFPPTRLMQIDIDPAEIGRNRTPDVGITGDAKAVLAQLIAAGSGRLRPERRAGWISGLAGEDEEKRAELEKRMSSGATPIHPLRLCKEVRDFLPRGAVLCVDGQEILNYARSAIPFYAPHSLNSGPYGCMGVGLPFGLGAKAAMPDALVVVLHGDGSFGLNAMEMDTALRHRLPVICIISNNGGWTATDRPKTGRDLGFTRYDLMFGAIGCHAEYVEDPGQIRPALERAAASGTPAVVNVITDPTARAQTARYADYST